jgi:hypothetical protein
MAGLHVGAPWCCVFVVCVSLVLLGLRVYGGVVQVAAAALRAARANQLQQEAAEVRVAESTAHPPPPPPPPGYVPTRVPTLLTPPVLLLFA